MQIQGLVPRFLQVPGVVDNVIGDGQPVFPAGLRRYHAPRLLFGFRVSGKQAVDLGLLITVNDKHAVDERPEGRLDQQGNHNQLVVSSGTAGLLYRGLANTRMQDFLQLVPGGLVPEYDLAHCGAIKIAIRPDDLVAECFADLIECGFTGLHNFPGNDVGVDDRHAEFGEYIGDRGLAACNATGQADSQRLVVRAIHLERKIEEAFDRVAPEHRDPAGTG